MLYTLGVLAFAIGLLASIALHEVGHMVPAKKFGVKVTQYMVGFGPTLWSKKSGDTEYGIKAIPLGGYIRMIGMIPPREDGKRSRWPRRLADLAEDFRNSSRADIEPDDGPREFYRLAPWKKIVVMVGGPSMNLLIYLVLTIILLGTIGTKQSTNKIDYVAHCVAPATSNAPDVALDKACPVGTNQAPADNVLKSGDKILAIDGVTMKNWNATVEVIQESTGKKLAITIERDGTDQIVSLTPVRNLKHVSDTSTKTFEAGFIGVGTVAAYQVTPLSQIPGQIGTQVGQGLDALGNFPSKIGSLFGTVFEGKKRDPNGAVGVVGLGRIGGQVASSHIAFLDKAYILLFLLAGINLLLFFFNLLPLLPLDGGHVAGAVVEAIKRRFAARREKVAVGGGPHPPRRPIYVDTAQMVPVLYGFAALLLAFTLLVVYADIVNPITLN
jgi:membrane-associated protease RseP (regulator of RpoE activity)